MALKTTFPYHQRLTPPDSPTEGLATPRAIVKNLKHLFEVFLDKVLLDLTNQDPPNTPVSQDQPPPGADVVRQVLECASAELSMAIKPAQSSASGEQGTIPGPETPEAFQSFENWACTPQFKTVKETYVVS